MGKLKRVPVKKKKSILHKGKEIYRTVEDARAAQKVMAAFAPQAEDYELVELLAANNCFKKDAAAYFGISEQAFDKHFDDHYTRGAMRRNLKVTKTLFDSANGHQGIYDAKKRRWLVRPRSPDMTALIWWDKTRGGWADRQEVHHKGKIPATVTQNVVVFLPPNGREAGAGGDPTFVLRQMQQPVLEGRSTEVSKSKAVKNKPAR